MVLWDNKEITVPVEFRKLTQTPLEKERLVVVKKLCDEDKEEI